MSNPIYLYYWDNILNLGDVLGLFIVQSLADAKIEYKNPFIKWRSIVKAYICDILFRQHNFEYYVKKRVPSTAKILFSVGSILDWATNNSVVWGSGFREQQSTTRSKNIYAVRGLRTRALLPDRFSNVNIGDPGLLLPLILPPSQLTNQTPTSNGISVIAHFKDKELECVKNTPYHKIDIQTSDIERFVSEIKSSKFILSSSLHGIIISHAYGVPALWIRGDYTGSSDFKFFDYLSIFSLDKGYPILNADEVLFMSRKEIEDLFDRYYRYSKPDEKAVSAIQKGLLKSAPFKLKERYNVYL